jgi:hypothetical protein
MAETLLRTARILTQSKAVKPPPLVRGNTMARLGLGLGRARAGERDVRVQGEEVRFAIREILTGQSLLPAD